MSQAPPASGGDLVRAPDPRRVLRFSVAGDISHAAHFVQANWPAESKEAPHLDMTTHPMALVFELTARSIRTLQDVLGRATLIRGPLATSARAFRMMLAAKLTGRAIPGCEPSAGTRAG
jgi:hypothetical protein